MPIILAIESSSELASVALLHGDQAISRATADVLTHSQSVLPLVQQLLAEAGIGIGQCDALAFGNGPGSFTGVRTACGIVQGLAFGAALPVIPVSTLLAMAQACRERGGGDDVLALLDARMDELYWARYQHDGEWQIVAPPALSAPAQILPMPGSGALSACGNGLRLLESAGGEQGVRSVSQAFLSSHDDVMPHALQVARLAALAYGRGELLDAREAQPLYLRNRVALTTAERAQAQFDRVARTAGPATVAGQ